MKPKITQDMTERQRLIEFYRTAFNRAYNEGVVAYRHIDPATGQWDLSADVPSTSGPEVYRVTGLGKADWADLACSCPGGNHRACKHRAIAAFAYKNGVWAVRNTAKCDGCHPYFCNGGCPDAPRSKRLTPLSAEAYQDIEQRIVAARLRRDPEELGRLEAQLDAADRLREASLLDPVHTMRVTNAKKAAEADHDARVARINAGGLTPEQEKHHIAIADENRRFRIKQVAEHQAAQANQPKPVDPLGGLF